MSELMIMRVKLYLKIRDTFSSAHYIPNHPKCGKLHGHNYKVVVTLELLQYSENQLVIDFGHLKDILRSILQKLDHRTLNDIISFPSAENIALYIFAKFEAELDRKMLPARVHRVEVFETEKYSAVVERSS